jgi:hypothetical protein
MEPTAFLKFHALWALPPDHSRLYPFPAILSVSVTSPLLRSFTPLASGPFPSPCPDCSGSSTRVNSWLRFPFLFLLLCTLLMYFSFIGFRLQTDDVPSPSSGRPCLIFSAGISNRPFPSLFTRPRSTPSFHLAQQMDSTLLFSFLP